MTEPRLVLGVDGGNRKTIALAALTDGSAVGAARVEGCADMYNVGIEAAVAVLQTAVDRALDQVGAPLSAVAAVVLSLAGVDWPEDAREMSLTIGQRWPAMERVVVVNDAIGALRATIPEGPGVVIACGTGVAVGARGPHGGVWHSGFWSVGLGGLDVAIQGLHAVVRADLGIDGPTVLRQMYLDRVGVGDVEGLLRACYARGGPASRFDLAHLAPLVLDAAEGGDGAATAIIDDLGRNLGQFAMAAARRVGLGEDFQLALIGGVFAHPSPMLRCRTLAEAGAGARAAAAGGQLEPAAGALLMAFDAVGSPAVPPTFEALQAAIAAVSPSRTSRSWP